MSRNHARRALAVTIAVAAPVLCLGCSPAADPPEQTRAAVANLDPKLLAALREAAAEAADDGVELEVTSGWRSTGYQKQLFQEAVTRFGSDHAAERWVARPGTSVHEDGDAVDIGPSSAATWLAEHGASFGLCRIYGNEPWHFELRPDAIAEGCPETYADPTHDPRLQR
ncbi:MULTISPECIES: D-alanyl-D-alanine carboxypeptidase family protein [Mumia]|uniref:D-alanyl-D-alanine carboxypeptidase family protein n=1 Tax=Mumia TaxID=1546255 RepID=UPI001FBA8034|nr:D-alanyl-D-alanine carboxypeptidase family protein [Mumia sp. ZJ430]